MASRGMAITPVAAQGKPVNVGFETNGCERVFSRQGQAKLWTSGEERGNYDV